MPAPRFALSFSLLASGAVLFIGGVARAEDPCNVDTDCTHGFSCQVVATSDCASPACPPNADCPAPPPCVAQTVKGCRPLTTCNAHSDCADGWVCYEDTQQQCTAEPGAACPPDSPNCKAPPPPPPDCTTVTTRSCVPRYALPCGVDADCGAGFTCVQDLGGCGCAAPAAGGGTSGSSGSASGSSGSSGSGVPTPPSSATPPSSDPSVPAPAPAPTPTSTPCTCPPVTTKHCEVQAVTCTVDSDCPSTWKCTVVGATAGGACGAPVERLPDGGFKVGETTCDPPAPTTETKECRPANYYGGTLGAKGSDSSGVGTGNAGSPIPSVDPGSPSVPPTQGPTGGSTTGSSAEHGADNAGNPAGSSSDNSGCQMGPRQGAAGGASVLGLLALAGIARRRRTRWG